jgi:hypothetical protein
MYGHERSLVEKMQGKPFVLLGVNTDEDREEIKQVIEEKRLGWRSWWDGSTDGPISQKWEIKSFPTIFLIDQKGIIRYRGPQGKSFKEAMDNLDVEIERLVKEAEDAK